MYQLQESRHTPPRYRVARPVMRAGKLKRWESHSEWTLDQAEAERWLAERIESKRRFQERVNDFLHRAAAEQDQ